MVAPYDNNHRIREDLHFGKYLARSADRGDMALP